MLTETVSQSLSCKGVESCGLSFPRGPRRTHMVWVRLASMVLIASALSVAAFADSERPLTPAERAARQLDPGKKAPAPAVGGGDAPAQRAARQLATRPEMASRGGPTPIFLDPIRIQIDSTRSDMLDRAREEQARIDQIIFEESIRRRSGANLFAAGLTGREASLVQSLEDRDRDVRLHEEAHFEAGSPFTSLPEYFTVTGPDGRSYAISGVTPMDSSLALRDKEEVLQKLNTLRRAALAPRQPSSHDLQLAREIERVISEVLAR
ncbi:MAG: hypothetical protein EXQ96_06170 [Alphaproteobacteria bacterium]|nr:hypothetical protein [Alphaproteobacteria bacterium]